MLHDPLAQDLYVEICRIPLIDCHTHIDPHRPTARNLDEILGYHYYTELAHSAGMDPSSLRGRTEPRERVRDILYHMNRFDNTAQYKWFLEIARAFLDFQGSRLTLADCTWLCDTADWLMAQPDWEEQVLHQSNMETIFLTNDFDDPLEGFDTKRYVPCLRTDDLVFQLHRPEIRQRLARATGVEVGDPPSLRRALATLFEHFTRRGARGCALSLPPDFVPAAVPETTLSQSLAEMMAAGSGALGDVVSSRVRIQGTFWMLAELCGEFKLPFTLMIGVNRRVYEQGVFQGQDLFDQRTSLIQYAALFNAFPKVP
ncbi:MAG: glucuronate isomerase, partial [Planctomycetes bacterium]|nr:glucuronate isomerase [Planctomycetota bacterium]